MKLKSLLLAGIAALAASPAPAAADTTLKLVEVITSPERTETLKAIVKTFEDANPGVKVEITSLPWGQAFEKFATMVSAGDTPGRRRDARPLAVALRQQRHAGEPRALSRQVGAHRRAERSRAADGRATSRTPPTRCPTASICAPCSTTRSCSSRPASPAPPKTMDEFTDDAKKISALPGKYGYCLRGGPGGLNGWVMFGAAMNGDNTFFKEDGTSTFADPGWVKGVAWLADLYKNGYAPKDAVNWGFNEIVAGFYSGTCAMLDQDPDALIAVAERMKQGRLRRRADAEGRRRQGLPDARLRQLVDVLQQREQGPRLEADRDARRAGGQRRLEQEDRRAADLQDRPRRIPSMPTRSSRAGSTSSPTRTSCRRSCRPICRSSPSSPIRSW